MSINTAKTFNHVLLVEYDRHRGPRLQSYLENEGFSVTQAGTPEEADYLYQLGHEDFIAVVTGTNIRPDTAQPDFASLICDIRSRGDDKRIIIVNDDPDAFVKGRGALLAIQNLHVVEKDDVPGLIAALTNLRTHKRQLEAGKLCNRTPILEPVNG